MVTKKQAWLFAFVTLIVLLIVFLAIPYCITKFSWGWTYNDKTGFIGDTIGGTVGPIVGFIGVILTFLAFYIQYQANELQRQEIVKQEGAATASERVSSVRQIEGTFFELLRLHKENVRDMNLKDVKGLKVLIRILYQFYDAFKYVSNESDRDKYFFAEIDRINIAYLITYFGVNVNSHNPIDRVMADVYPKDIGYIMKLIAKIREGVPEKSENYSKRTLAGHQSRLGHYFRNLFMIVTFIHENNILNDDEKRKYIKFLRVQLSVQEQILFFFNSLSVLGKSWEKSENILPENKLITKYQLIRNIPALIEGSISPKTYYPGLRLEQDF